ncbi:MAG: MBL fold metallo-hydrolase, partial [Acidobacteriales bacterium]|nr:MBL fold metallo-hydrolase [Terriglobales bacterium]
TASVIERIFEYTFRTHDRYTTSARVEMHRISTDPGTTVELFGAVFQRIPVQHGRQVITGWRFGKAAYLTDLSSLPEESFPLLEDLDILILDALRRAPHPSHSNLENSIALVERIKPRRAFFTHISHDLEHDAINAELPPHIRMSYDGMCLDFDIAEDRTAEGRITGDRE